MMQTSSAFGVHALRLTPGADLKGELQRFAEARGLRAGFILSCVGSLARARLRAPGAEAYLTFDEPTEIVSLGGTLSPDGVHLHVSLSRRDGACVGGHLVAGCLVNTTAELVVGEALDLEFGRSPDPDTGFAELDVRPRRPGRGFGGA